VKTWRAHPWWLALALLGLILHGGTAMLRLGSFWPYPRLLDFSGFYAAAWAWRAGLSPYALPEGWLTALMRTQAIPFRPPPIYNPPLLVLLLQPLTLVPFPLAAWLWVALNVGLALLSAGWLAELAGIRSKSGKALVALLVLTYGPLWLDVSLGQLSVLLLTCALLWLRAVDARRLTPSALALGLASGVKVFPLYWLGAALFARRWRALAAGLAAVVLLLALSWVLAPEANRIYWGEALGGRLSSSASQPGVDDQSLLAWAMRLTQPQTFTSASLDAHSRIQISWEPRVSISPVVVGMMVAALLLVLGLLSVWQVWRAAGEEQRGAWTLWLLLGLIGLVHVERYNHVLLLPALAWLWGARPQRRGRVILAYVLEGLGRLTHAFALYLSFPWAAWASGWGLYAALVTFGLMMGSRPEGGRASS